MTITDPRLARETTRVPRRSDYVKRPVLSATIHPDLKRTLVAMTERTGMTVSQVTDEVLYTGLVEMQELEGWGSALRTLIIQKVVRLIYACQQCSGLCLISNGPLVMPFVFSNGSSWMACGVYHIQLSTYVISTSPVSNSH